MRRLLIASLASLAAVSAAHAEGLDEASAARFAQLALDCVHKEYPNKIAHVMTSDTDLKPPRQLTPAFYGCFDWHSSVHGHWLLARVIKLFPKSEVAGKARAVLALSLTPQNIATEVTYITTAGRESFERPYGLAWLLQLAAELRTSDDRQFREWAATLAPMEAAAAKKLTNWLPKLNYPIRVGEHDQTAFAFGLVWDWAQTTKDSAMESLLREKAKQFYLARQELPAGVRTVRAGFCVPVSCGGGFRASGACAGRVRALAYGVHAAGGNGWLHRVAARREDHGSQ